MTEKKEIKRGIRAVRTLSSIRDLNPQPHRVFMKISALEMEKNRQLQERDNALRRVNDIDQRLQEIEEETAALLAALNLNPAEAPPEETAGTVETVPPARRRSASKPSRPQSQSRQKFVIKY